MKRYFVYENQVETTVVAVREQDEIAAVEEKLLNYLPLDITNRYETDNIPNISEYGFLDYARAMELSERYKHGGRYIVETRKIYQVNAEDSQKIAFNVGLMDQRAECAILECETNLELLDSDYTYEDVILFDRE